MEKTERRFISAGRQWANCLTVLMLATGVLFLATLKGQTSATYPVGRQPWAIAFDGTNLWLGHDAGSHTVTKVLAASGTTVGTYPVAGSSADAIAFDGTNIWVPGPNTLVKRLASSGAILGSYPLASYYGDILFDGTNIWVAGSPVTKLLAATGQLLATYSVGTSPRALGFDGTNIWVADNSTNTVTKLLASTGAIVGTYPVGTSPVAITFDGTNIWVVNGIGNTVTKLVAATGVTVGTYPVGSLPTAIAFDGSNIWVANFGSSNVTKLLAGTGAIAGTYPVGQNPRGMVFDGSNIWVTNWSSSTLTRINKSPGIPSISVGGIVPVYSSARSIQPGGLVSIWGSDLASGTTLWKGDFPTSLGGTTVTVNTKPAYLVSVSPGQINLQAPDDNVSGPVNVVVTTAAGSATSSVTLAQFAPSFFLLDSKHVAGIIVRLDGSGAYGAGTYDIIGPTGTALGYQTVAAKPGDVVALYGTGFGPTNPTVPAGRAFDGAAPTNNQVTVLMNNVKVIPTFAGLSGAGVYQINLTVPVGLGTGDISLVANVGGVQTPVGVVISVRQ